MNFASHSLRLHRSGWFAAMLIATCSPAMLRAAPAPVPVPPTAPTEVTVTNPASIAKAEGIQHPFQLEVSCDSPSSASCELSFRLPANRRLVLEYVSSKCLVPANTVLLSMDVSTTVAPATPTRHVLNHVDHPPIDPALPHLAIAAHSVKLYADAGSDVILHAALNVAQAWNCDFSLSGQTVDVP